MKFGTLFPEKKLLQNDVNVSHLTWIISLHYLEQYLVKLEILFEYVLPSSCFTWTPKFIPPQVSPPNSPYLNPVDYSVWGLLQEKVCKISRVTDLHELKQRLRTEWAN